MKVTHEQIIKIIRESILSELQVNDPDFSMGATPSQAWSSADVSGSPALLAEIILGLTPAGIVIDSYYMYKALVAKDPELLGLAAVGFIPGIGDLKKLTKADLDKVANELGEEGMAQLRRQADDASRAASRASRTARTIASEIPWADKTLWIVRGNDYHLTGGHQIVALRDKQGKAHLFYKSSATNPDEYGRITDNWIRFEGLSPAANRSGPYFYWVKSGDGLKRTPPHLQPLADQLDELDRAMAGGPGIADIKGLSPDFKVRSMSEEFTLEGIEDAAKFNRWAHSIGATMPHGLKKGLVGINISVEDVKSVFGL